MIAKIIRQDGEYKLISVKNGINVIKHEDLKNMLLTFKDPEHYKGKYEAWPFDVPIEDYCNDITVGIIDDNFQIIIKDEEFLYDMVVLYGGSELISSNEYGKLHGVKERQIRNLIEQGKLKAKMVNGGYLIPKDTPYPVKKRNRSKPE